MSKGRIWDTYVLDISMCILIFSYITRLFLTLLDKGPKVSGLLILYKTVRLIYRITYAVYSIMIWHI